jgi:hypothetical protein
MERRAVMQGQLRPPTDQSQEPQMIKTWKQSSDPDFEAKKNRILHLYGLIDGTVDAQPGDADAVVCVDEFGPLNLQPHPGRQWPLAAGGGLTPRRRRRATYTRPHGVRTCWPVSAPIHWGGRSGRGGRRVRCWSHEGVLELGAGADLELAIGVAQVHLDRLDRDEQRLRDLLVAHPIGRQLSHAPLARGQGVKPGLEDLARPGTGGGDLVVGPPGEPERAARLPPATR